MRELRKTGHPQIDSALAIAFDYAEFEGAHHKQWLIDQMVIALCGGEDSVTYTNFVEDYENQNAVEEEDYFQEEDEEGEDDFEDYDGYSVEWDKGISP
jgi:hypothetical protein